jgi:hypothetical protein
MMSDSRSPDPRLPDPQLTFAFEARVDVDRMVHVGGSGADPLLFFPITGGTVHGPRLDGTIIPGGGDWATARGDLVTELEARYLIRADDGAVIDIVNRGFHRAVSQEQLDRMDAGDDFPETEYYYRTSPIFRTDAPQHRWLTHTVFVGMARSEGAQVCIRFFEVA